MTTRVGLAALLTTALLPAFGAAAGANQVGAAFDPKTSVAYPPTPAVIDVTKPPYNAKGDGVADDTDALQKALSDTMGRHKIVYLPNGTYLVSRSLRWAKKNTKGEEAWGFNHVQGQNPLKTVIRLKDDTFTDVEKPVAMMWCGGFGSADWFHNYVQGVTFNVGRGNPGAVGLQFYSNNTGAVRDVAVVSEDGRGFIGLDLAPADMNGPLLVRNVMVQGFETGVRTGGSVNSQTFERLTLTGQTKVGLANRGQSVSVRGLSFAGGVTAVDAQSFTVLVDCKLSGTGAAARLAPGVNVGKAAFFARNVTATGYRVAVAFAATGREELGPAVAEAAQGAAGNPFGGPVESPGLPVAETPEVPWDAPAGWAVVDAFGADPTGNKDSSAAVQMAIDSGATTVFFPGSYSLSSPVRVRGKARRLLGAGGWLDYNKKTKPDLIVEDGESPGVVVEHFAPINGGVEVKTSRTVTFRSVEAAAVTFKGKGEVFFEDVVTNDLRFNPGQRVWARQLNVENEGTHLTNDGGMLWVLGYKTERGGTLLRTTGGGTSEILGNFSYTTTAGKLAPMFVTENATAFAFFNEVCYTGDPFRTLARDVRGTAAKELKRGDGGLSPYVSWAAVK